MDYIKKVLPKTIYVLSYVIIIFLILLVYVNLSENDLKIWFNSDMLFLPSLFKDVFLNGYHFEGWTLPGAPSYFPDMFFCFVLMAITNNITITALLMAIIQIVALLAFVNYLFKIVFPNANLYDLALSNLFLSFFLITFLFNNDISLTYYIVNYSNHFTSFVMAILALNFTFKYLKKPSFLALIGLILTILLSVLSDKLFLVFYTFPIFVVLVLRIKKHPKKNTLILLSTNIIFTYLGHLLLGYVVKYQKVILAENFNILEFSKIKSSLLLVIYQVTEYFLWFNLVSMVLAISVLTFLILTIYLVFIYLKKSSKYEILNTESFSTNYIIFIYAFLLLVIAAPIINGTYLAYDHIRYLIPSLYLSILSFPILVSQTFNVKIMKQIIKWITITLTTFYIGYILFISISSPLKANLDNLVNYYPESAKFVDSLYVDKELKMGISTYWDAKVATMFSKNDARIYTIYDDDFAIYTHTSNPNWYFKIDYGKYSNPVFNFVLATDVYNTTSLITKLGQPLDIFYYKNYILFKYPDFGFDKTTHIPYLLNDKSTMCFSVNNNCDSLKDWNSVVFTFSNEKSYSGKYSDKLDEKRQYSLTYAVNWADILKYQPTKIKISTIVNSSVAEPQADFVLEIVDNNNNIEWSSIKLKTEILKSDKWTQISGIFFLPVAKLTNNSIIKVYGFSLEKKPIYFDDYKIDFIK